VASVAVTFAVPGTSNGSITGGNQTTNTSGIAQVTSWTLGTQAKPDTLTATSTGLGGSPVTFVDTAKGGAAANMVPFSGDHQVGRDSQLVGARGWRIGERAELRDRRKWDRGDQLDPGHAPSGHRQRADGPGHGRRVARDIHGIRRSRPGRRVALHGGRGTRRD